MSDLTVVNYGGGVNSTALLIGLIERSVPVDLILFADTGGEREETYAYTDTFSEWLVSRGCPPVTKVRRKVIQHETLEDECHNNKTLPSIAFGFRSCSMKWKRDPMDKFIRNWDRAKEVWAAGGKVIRLLGIDAGESHRGKIPNTERWEFRRPLVDWDWDRFDCLAAIERAGLPSPGKSACFFCPASKKREVLALAKDRPDLFERALAIEKGAAESLNTVRGLGRDWSWEEIVAADKAQFRLFQDTYVDEPCMCFDGESFEESA